MALIRGPFNLKWGDNEIQDVETIETELTVDSEDVNTVGGVTYELDGAYKATVTLTLLSTDIAALAAILPQYFVPNGQQMSTGETVNNANGAIDVKAASCDEATVYNDLDIIACGSPASVYRLVNARTRIDAVNIDDKLQRVDVKFIGEPAPGEGNVQFFIQGTINVVS